MKKASAKSANGKKSRPKIKLGIPDLEHSKNAVLRSLGSPDLRRGYQHAIDEFVAWYCSEPRLAFNKTVVLRYRFHLQERGLAPGTINVRLAAVTAEFGGYFVCRGSSCRGSSAGHGGLRDRTRTSAWQTDCPSGSRAKGRGHPGERAAQSAAIGKLSPY